jgi:hypothetical protein
MYKIISKVKNSNLKYKKPEVTHNLKDTVKACPMFLIFHFYFGGNIPMSENLS